MTRQFSVPHDVKSAVHLVRNETPTPLYGDSERDDTIYIERFSAICRRQWKVVVLAVIMAISLGLVYVSFAIPLYTASTSVMIDRPEGNLVGQLSTIGTATEDDATVVSEVELLNSKALAYAVIDQLKLHDDIEFLGQYASLSRRLIDTAIEWLRTNDVLPARDQQPSVVEERRRQALAIIQKNILVSRVGRSYVLSLYYRSPSPEMSARIAGAFADVYVVDKLNSKFEATRRASNWLQDRIEELGSKATVSDLAVQLFREEKGLVTADGKLISDQQLSELNSALIIAKSNTAQARARLDRIRSILANGSSDAIVPDVLESSISNDLRAKYLDAAKLEADVSGRYGKGHAQAMRLRGEMNEYKRLMFGELSRIAESYQSEMEVAVAKEKELAESVALAERTATKAGKTQVQLRELQRSAETYRKLHETFLQRYHESVQEQSFPVTEARIIEPAEIPTTPTYPHKPLIVALYAFLGAVFGTAVGGIRELRDRFFRTGEQVRNELRIEYLGSLPLITSKPLRSSRKPSATDSATVEVEYANTVASFSVEHPRTMYAETLRSAKIAVDTSIGSTGKPKVVGFVSALPGEGKSTVAVNFAQLISSQGARTLLIDADLRNPGATRLLAARSERGTVDVLLEDVPLSDVVVKDKATGLSFLPSVIRRHVPHSADLLSSEAMQVLISRAKIEYDYIVLDLPPLGPVIDARAAALWVDNFVLVIEWGRASRRMVKDTLFSEREIMSKTRGAILNKVDTKKLKFYRAYGSAEYYYPTYHSYYKN